MFYAEGSSNNDYMLYRIKDNVKGNLEYYYHANMILTVFAVGAFSLYIATGVSRGIFLLLDLFLIFKATKKFFKTRKMRDKISDIDGNLKYIKSLLVFDTIILVEATIRYFLELNIAIFDYLWIGAIAYSTVLIGYKLIKSFNKKRIYEAISENRYEDVILLKKKKEKIFTVVTLFLVVFLILIRVMNIVKGGGFIALMTVIYTVILFFNIDMSSEVSIEYGLLVKGDINNIERDILVTDYEPENGEVECDEVKVEKSIKNDDVDLGKTIAFKSEDLDKTAAFSYGEVLNDIEEKQHIEKVEPEEEKIKSRVERNRNKNKSLLDSLENIEYEKYLEKIKETKEKGKNITEKGKNIKRTFTEKIEAVRKRIDRDK